MFRIIVVVLFCSVPISFAVWAWQYWFLRPLAIYAGVMPWFLLPLSMLIYIPRFLLPTKSLRERSRRVFDSLFWEHMLPAYMRIWHGYEINGLDNLPQKNEGALVAFYHGVIPYDLGFANAAIWKHHGRRMQIVAHRFIFRLPLIGGLIQELGAEDSSREHVISRLRNGALVAVAPGGMYEAMFSENYSVEFAGRSGFAAAAKEANVPIIPMFTENVREFQTVHLFGLQGLLRWLHETYKLQFFWAFGGWPVKLRTHLGEPIYCKENETPQQFARRVKEGIENLRDSHQKRDGSVIRALLERFS